MSGRLAFLIDGSIAVAVSGESATRPPTLDDAGTLTFREARTLNQPAASSSDECAAGRRPRRRKRGTESRPQAQGYSPWRGRSSWISYQDAFEPTNMCAVGLRAGSSVSDP